MNNLKLRIDFGKILKEHWLVISTIIISLSQVIAVNLEQQKLATFNVDLFAIIEVSDLPMLLFCYPEITVIITQLTFGFIIFNSIEKTIKNNGFKMLKSLSTWLYIIVIISILISSYSIMSHSKIKNHLNIYQSKSFQKIIKVDDKSNQFNNCYGYLSSTSKYIIFYDFDSNETLVMNKSQLRNISFLSNTDTIDKCRFNEK